MFSAFRSLTKVDFFQSSMLIISLRLKELLFQIRIIFIFYNMIFLNFLFFILKIFIIFLRVSFFYIIFFILRFFHFIALLPVSAYFLIKILFTLLFVFFKRFIHIMYVKILSIADYIYRNHLVEAIYQFSYHFKFSVIFFKNKIFRRYYFYRRFYRFYPRVKLLIMSILTVELNSLLIRNLVQPSKSTCGYFGFCLVV